MTVGRPVLLLTLEVASLILLFGAQAAIEADRMRPRLWASPPPGAGPAPRPVG